MSFKVLSALFLVALIFVINVSAQCPSSQDFTLSNSLENSWVGQDAFGNTLYYYQITSTITNVGSGPILEAVVFSPSAGDLFEYDDIVPVGGSCDPDPVCYFETPSYENILAGATYEFDSTFGFIEPETDFSDLWYPCNE